MERQEIERRFYKLISRAYDMKNPKVSSKYWHSLNVAYLMAKYAKDVGANPELAFTIGLLHDFGRFYQVTFYDTFDDSESIDHAVWGVKKLDECDLYKYFDILPLYENVVREAILNHSKYQILKNPNTEEGLMQTKLLRDCDKLSILDQYIKVRFHEIKEDVKKDEKINPVILDTMSKGNLNKFSNVSNGLDEICFYMSYIYDINYDFIYKEVLSYINIMLEFLKKDERFDIVKEYIDSYSLERKRKLC